LAAAIAAFLEELFTKALKETGRAAGLSLCNVSMAASWEWTKVSSVPNWQSSASMEGRMRSRLSNLRDKGRKCAVALGGKSSQVQILSVTMLSRTNLVHVGHR